MGKIRVSTLGSEKEKELQEKQKIRREEKKKRQEAEKVHVSGMKGGARVKSVGASTEEEINKMANLAEEVDKDQAAEGQTAPDEKAKRKLKPRSRSKRYKDAVMMVDRNKQYGIEEALELLRKVNLANFDCSVELHINASEKGLRGSLTLPHGTGKQVRVAVADGSTIDKIVKQVEDGKIDFDALVAHPSVMGKLAKVAKYLGPKGLMPNPKAGTISPTPEKVADKLKGGEITWKTESDFPIIHQVIGKMSFKDKQLAENYKAMVKSISPLKIKGITVKSSMSPGIKVSFS